MNVKLKKLAEDVKQAIKMTDDIMYLVSKSIMSKSYLKQIHIYKDNYQQNYTLKDHNDAYDELINLFEENSKEVINEDIIINKCSKINNIIINTNIDIIEKEKLNLSNEMKGTFYSIEAFLDHKNLFEVQEVKEYFDELDNLLTNKIDTLTNNHIIRSHFAITFSSKKSDGSVYIYLQLVCDWRIGDYDIF